MDSRIRRPHTPWDEAAFDDSEAVFEDGFWGCIWGYWKAGTSREGGNMFGSGSSCVNHYEADASNVY